MILRILLVKWQVKSKQLRMHSSEYNIITIRDTVWYDMRTFYNNLNCSNDTSLLI